MGSQLIGSPLNGRLISKVTNCFPAKAHATKTPSLSKEQLDQLLQLLKPAPLTPGTPITSLA